jgi:subtilisin family serine protease
MRLVVVLMVLVFSGMPANSIAFSEVPDPSTKISGLLYLQIEDKAQYLENPAAASEIDISKAVGIRTENLAMQRIYIYFSLTPSASQVQELQDLGIILYQDTWIPPVGNHPAGFLLADMPIDKLDELASKSYAVKLDTAEQVHEPQNDLAVIKTNVDNVWDKGYDGSGITIAVLDSGLDTAHPDIPAPIGSWDYAENDATIGNTVTGHGTHVVGSALGRGTQSAGQYRGVAPGADLVFLKIGRDLDSMAPTAATVNAMHDAVEVYNADIITYSYGGWSQYHDGSSATDQAVDYAHSQGAAVFCSAGNAADNDQHYSGLVGASGTTNFIRVDVSWAGAVDTALFFNLVWFDDLGVHNDLDIEYYDSGYNLLDSTASLQSESPRGTESVYSYHDYYVPGYSTYYLKVMNNAPVDQFFHIYYDSGLNRAGAGWVTFQVPDPFYTLGTPATADNAIAVGSYTTRESWTDYRGNVGSYGETNDTISTFSSRGPRVDEGVPKPNIVAPGSVIISVRDMDVYTLPGPDPGYDREVIDNDGINLDGSGPADYFVMHGTSMASPHAAGVAALLLQARPELVGDPVTLRGVLEVAAGNNGAHDNTSGYGLVDANAMTPDTTPPASITNLQNTTGQTWINWAWANPPDSDFNHTMMYLDGTWKTNTSDPFYTATELNPDACYEIATHTVDKVGNINRTWINDTATTLPSGCTPPDIDWNVTISATNQLEPVVVGMDPNATDGYDQDYDVYAQTPVQGRVTLTLDNIYSTSIKKTRCYNESVSWALLVGVPTDQTTILSWEVPANVDLTITEGGNTLYSGVELSEGAHELLVTVELIESITFGIDLKAGWNMVSVPLAPDNCSVYAIFGSIPTLETMPVVTWESPSFVEVEDIEPKIGYWVFTPADTTITVAGKPITNTTLILEAGWNMVGTVGLDHLTISAIPNQVPQRPAVTWVAPSFVETGVIEPGKSAWVFVTTDTIVIPSRAFSTDVKARAESMVTKNLARIRAAPTATIEEWNLTISATNQLEPVTFGIHPDATNGYDGGFDVYAQTPVQDKVILILDSIYATEINKDTLTWNLGVGGVSAGQTTTLAWNPSQIPADVSLTLNGIDMKSQDSMELGEGSHSFVINAEYTTIQVTISLDSGWNLISSPLNLTIRELGEEAAVGDPLNVTPENSLTSIYRYNTTSELFEKCTHYAGWGWAPATGSESFTELEPGRGYWVMAEDDCDLTFTGTAPSDLDVPLDADWNCIGWYSTSEVVLGEEAAVGDPLSVTPENSLTSIYRYNTTSELFEKCTHYDDWGWAPATGSESFTELEPGRGYWAMADNDCLWGHEV